MINNKLKKPIKELSEYKPGKTKKEISKKYSVPIDKIIALASNENPFGTPKKSQKAIKDVSKRVFRYPSPNEEKKLKDQIKEFLDLSEEIEIILGPGEDGVLENIMKTFVEKGDKTTIPYPTFSMYQIMTKIHDAEPSLVERKNDFSIPKDKLMKSSEDSKITFICSPNNPTGNLVDKSLLKELLQKDILVVLDTAYGEFTDEDYLDLLKNNKNLILLKTFSKAFGLAGLRVGYGLTSNEEISKNLKKTCSPFSVSKPSLVAAKNALKSEKFLEKTIKEVKKGRDYFDENIKFKTHHSEANFVLIETPENSKKTTEKLMKDGIIVRDCSEMMGMGKDYLRVSVGKMKENKKVVNAINEL